MTSSCRLELLGLYSTDDYRWHADNILAHPVARRLVSGVNIVDHAKGAPCLDWMQAVVHKCPGIDVCVHYSLANRAESSELSSANDMAEVFEHFCAEACESGAARILLISGPGGYQKPDSIDILEEIAEKFRTTELNVNHRCSFGDECPRSSKRQCYIRNEGDKEPTELRDRRPLGVRIGIAFNPCSSTPELREKERCRVRRKIQTGLINDVWLNTGVDTVLLREGLSFVNAIASESKCRIEIFASVLRPNDGQRWQFRCGRNGVDFGARFLESLDGMAACTREAIALFQQLNVTPIVESKVHYEAHLMQLEELLATSSDVLADVHNLSEAHHDE